MHDQDDEHEVDLTGVEQTNDILEETTIYLFYSLSPFSFFFFYFFQKHVIGDSLMFYLV